MTRCLVPLLSLVFLATAACPASAQTRYVTIGTGGVTGNYYPTGEAIARAFKRSEGTSDTVITVESTPGSVANIDAIMRGDLDFGIVQSDRQFQAHAGATPWKGRPQAKLRSVLSIYTEAVTVVAAVDAGIVTLGDLKGKAVYIGSPGSGGRGNAVDLLMAEGIDPSHYLAARGEDIMSANVPRLLLEGALDAFIVTIGHPGELVEEATSGMRKVHLVPVGKTTVAKLLDEHSFYVPTAIPRSHYPAAVNGEAVPTFGVKATLCTSAEVSEELVYRLAKAVVENLRAIGDAVPACKGITPESMVQGLSAPLHLGALRYFKEIDVLE